MFISLFCLLWWATGNQFHVSNLIDSPVYSSLPNPVACLVIRATVARNSGMCELIVCSCAQFIQGTLPHSVPILFR